MIREYLHHARRFPPAARLFLAALFLFEAGASSVWLLRNLYFRQAGFDEEFIGYSLAASSLGMLAVVVTLTPLRDQMRLRGYLASGVALLAGGLAGSALLRDRPAVLAACLLTGVGLALVQVNVAPFISRHATAAERPYLFGLAMALSPCAGLLATLGVQAGALAWGEGAGATRNMLLAGAGCSLAALAVLLPLREAGVPPPEEEKDGVDWPVAARFFLPELFFGLGAGLTIPFINLYFRARFGLPVGSIGLLYGGAELLMMGAFLAAPSWPGASARCGRSSPSSSRRSPSSWSSRSRPRSRWRSAPSSSGTPA